MGITSVRSFVSASWYCLRMQLSSSKLFSRACKMMRFKMKMLMLSIGMLLTLITEVRGSTCYETNYELSNTYTCTASSPASSYAYEITVPNSSTDNYVVGVYQSSSNSSLAYTASKCQVTSNGDSCTGYSCERFSSTKYNCIRTIHETGNNEILHFRLKCTNSGYNCDFSKIDVTFYSTSPTPMPTPTPTTTTPSSSTATLTGLFGLIFASMV